MDETQYLLTPAPKQIWDAWEVSSTNAATKLIQSNTAGFDYWITVINVIQYQSAVGTEAFSMYTFNDLIPNGIQKNFWGGQVSPNTGVAFQYRGPFRIVPGDGLWFFNSGGFFFVYAQGFITSSDNEI